MWVFITVIVFLPQLKLWVIFLKSFTGFNQHCPRFQPWEASKTELKLPALSLLEVTIEIITKPLDKNNYANPSPFQILIVRYQLVLNYRYRTIHSKFSQQNYRPLFELHWNIF